MLESFPLGADRPPTTATIAGVTAYRSAQIRDVLEGFAAEV